MEVGSSSMAFRGSGIDSVASPLAAERISYIDATSIAILYHILVSHRTILLHASS